MLKYQNPTKKTENEIRKLWKEYAVYLFNSMTQNTTDKNKKIKKSSWKKSDLDKLNTLINKAYTEINNKFVSRTKHIVPSLKLKEVENNEIVRKAFEKKRDEHISYFKKFPNYVSQKLNNQLEKVTLRSRLPLAKRLILGENMSRRHANFIAKDQLAKLSNFVSSAHAISIGSDSYIWKTMCDSRVRPEHAHRQGKKFKFSKPPFGGEPGNAPGCRCSAEAIINL